MAQKLHFSLVSPDRQVLSEEVDHVVVPGSEGQFGVLPEHAPVMSTLSPGVLVVFNDGAEKRIFVYGGFAEVTPDGLTVLAEEAIPVEDLDAQDLAQRIQDAKEDLADADTDEKRLAAEQTLDHLQNMQAAL